MAEIAAEIMVGEGYEVTGPIDQKLKSLLSMIQVPTGGRPPGQKQETNKCEMGPSQQETPRELRRHRGRGTFADRECPV